MRPELENIELIEHYLEGRLDPEDQQKFAESLKADPELRSDVEIQKSIREGIEYAGLVSVIESEHEKFTLAEQSTQPWYFGLNGILVILSAVLITGLSLFLVWPKNKEEQPDHESTFARSAGPKESNSEDLGSNSPDIQLEYKDQSSTVLSRQDQTDFTSGPFSKQTNEPQVTDNLDSAMTTNQETVEKVQEEHFAQPEETMEAMVLPPGFTVPFQGLIFNAEEGGEFINNDGSALLSISSGSFVDEQGKAFHGEVTLVFRDYRNVADYAFSLLPFAQAKKDVREDFKSLGLFEIRAMSGNSELFLKEGSTISINYQFPEKDRFAFMYHLDESIVQWTPIGKTAWASNEEKLDHLEKVATLAWEQDHPGEKMSRKTASKIKDYAKDLNRGGTCPNLVYEFLIDRFGIFACLKRVPKPKMQSYSPDFVNSQGFPLNEEGVVTVLDLSNGTAASFKHDQFEMDPLSRQMILFYTASREMYLVDEATCRQFLSDPAASKLTAKNVTHEVSSVKDLQKVLEKLK